MSLLEIRNLSVTFPTAQGALRAVDGLDLDLDEGEVLGIVGESGSGKCVAMLAVMGLIRPPGRVTADVLRFDGRDLLALPPRARRRLIGKDVAMVFQEPTTSLNPCFTVGWQIAETLRVHLGLSRAAARDACVELLRQVGIPAPRAAPVGIPAPDVGRHEPARDDRDGDRLQSAPADRRRADHGARRHHPEADPGAAGRAAA